MYKKKTKIGKHLDFIILDLLVLIISYALIIAIADRSIDRDLLIGVCFVRLLCYFLSGIGLKSYKNILKRGYGKELIALVKQMAVSIASYNVAIYIMKYASQFSRKVYFLSLFIGLVLVYLARIAYKPIVKKRALRKKSDIQVLVVGEKVEVETVITASEKKDYNEFSICGICLLGDTGEKEILGIPVVCSCSDLDKYIVSQVIDEVLIRTKDKDEEKRLIELFLQAGLTVHKSLRVNEHDFPNATIESVGSQLVITTCVKSVSTAELALKRALDILGGIVGLIITGLLYLYIAPKIKKADPGPVFFKQPRVGKNGRVFDFYKFRSMYLDAEERKAALLAQNEMGDAKMFKIADDPRIIPGIGHLIRDTSLDEFPQFLCVLKGDMSLVGTRPPLLDEVALYDAHHKARLSFKPGITGLWQVSGRSDITDFEEIVRLDSEYIRNWSFFLDIKILLKTVLVVLKKDGAR